MQTRGCPGDRCTRQSRCRGLSGSISLSVTRIEEAVYLTHQIEVDTVINQVVLARFNIPRRAEVDAVLFANILHLLVGASQTNDARVELLQIFAQHLGAITSRVTGNENGQEKLVILGDLPNLVDNLGHLIQFVGADIGAVGETEVDL